MKNVNPTRKQRSRNQILDAALIEFEIHGVDDVSMEIIARRAGLTRATLYNLFSSKEEMAALLVQQKVAAWDETFRRRMDAGENGRELVVQALLKNAQVCIEFPKIAISVLTKPQKTALPETDDKHKSFRILIQDLLAHCQEQGSVRRDLAPAYLMFMVLGLFTQMMIFALTTNTKISGTHIDQMLQTLFEGIAGKHAGEENVT